MQVYARFTDSRTHTPNCQLCAVKAVTLAAGENAEFELCIDRYWLKAVLQNGERVDPDGEIGLYIGGDKNAFGILKK